MHILIVEDDRSIAENLYEFLESRGHQCDYADSLAAAGRLLAGGSFDCAVFDRSLPDGDALSLARRLRAEGSSLPVLMLTARDTLEDKLAGFDAGADDYLVKPFSIEELLARIRAHLRRVTPAITGEIRVSDLIINLEGREVYRGGRRIEFSNKEFELLELLAKSPGKVFSRFEIEEKVWPGYQGGSNVVDVYIGYLRKKLEGTGERRLIHTVRGVGYVLRED